MWTVLAETVKEFQKDECPRLAAALAYYMIFSLPALVLAIVLVAGIFVDQKEAAERLTTHVADTTSESVAEQIGGMLDHAPYSEHGWWGWLVGTAVLLVGATGALAEVQTALNRAWRVKPDPNRAAWRSLIVKRVVSLGMLLAIAFLLLVSLVVSWILSEFGQWIDDRAPPWLSSRVIWVLNTAVSLAIITLLFAAVLKFVPDAEVAWSDVWAGALVTALLFTLGKVGLGMYLAWSDPTSAYGAAGSLALVLLWIYYSAMILFFGAEFTQVLTRRRGKVIPPERGAVRAAAPAGS